MRTATFLLLVALCSVGAEGQKVKPKKRSNAEEKILFQTKGKDACTMTPIGHGEMKLRVECKNQAKSYWCEYAGKPSVCRNFNKNPKLYWTQISMELKKTTNACETKAVKPSMCPKAPAEAEMKQVATGSSDAPPAKPAQKPPAPKQVKEAPPAPGKAKKPSKAKPTAAPPGSTTPSPSDTEAMKLAKEHCWESLHGLCSYVIGFFTR